MVSQPHGGRPARPMLAAALVPAALVSAALGLGACTAPPAPHHRTSNSPAPTSSGGGGGIVTAPPIDACAGRPSAATTGAKGALHPSSVSTLSDHATLTNAVVRHLTISGSNVVVRNVRVEGGILVTGQHVVIDGVTAKGIQISSATDVTVRRSDIGYGQGDGIHVTSDRGRLVTRVTLDHNWVHDPRVLPTVHYDGTQVRGVEGMRITCSFYDAGSFEPPYNAAIYLQNANGGSRDVVIADNWLLGFGHSLMIDAANVTLEGNRFGGDIRWGLCYRGKHIGTPGLVEKGNVKISDSEPVAPCAPGGT